MATSALQALMGPAVSFVVFAIVALARFLLAPTPALAPAHSGLLLARPVNGETGAQVRHRVVGSASGAPPRGVRTGRDQRQRARPRAPSGISRTTRTCRRCSSWPGSR